MGYAKALQIIAGVSELATHSYRGPNCSRCVIGHLVPRLAENDLAIAEMKTRDLIALARDLEPLQMSIQEAIDLQLENDTFQTASLSSVAQVNDKKDREARWWHVMRWMECQ